MPDEKFDEKEREKQEEKTAEKSFDEKYRRDPLSAIIWAAILIWAGVLPAPQSSSAPSRAGRRIGRM